MIDLRTIAEKLGFPVKEDGAELPVQMQSLLQSRAVPGGVSAEKEVPKVTTTDKNGTKSLSVEVSPEMAYTLLSSLIKTEE